MDPGMKVLEGIVIFIVVGGFLVTIVPAIILDIIWYKRVKSKKSLLGLRYWLPLLKELADFVR